MAHNGFVIEAWAITVSAASLGSAVQEGTGALAALALAPLAAFAALDTYWLSRERTYRAFHESLGDLPTSSGSMSLNARIQHGGLGAVALTVAVVRILTT